MELMLKAFYWLRGLNDEGIPRETVLREQNLADLADLILYANKYNRSLIEVVFRPFTP
jgi:hypothetical protein